MRFPLRDRPGESLLVWTTTPWTLTSNVAAAVGPDLEYVQVRQGDRSYYLSRGTLRMLRGPYEVLRTLRGRELDGWRYQGPFDHLPASRDSGAPSAHRIVVWDEVGEEEGTGIVHIAPGCGAEDFALSKLHDLPVIAPLDEAGIFLAGFGPLTGKAVDQVRQPIFDDLQARGLAYSVSDYTHRYPVCWRCGSELVFRLVDEWFISMGAALDKPMAEVTEDEMAHNLRYQMLDVVEQRNALVSVLRAGPRTRLAAQYARLDDFEEALLGTGAADLRVRRVRQRRRDRKPGGTSEAGGAGLGGVCRPIAASAVRRRGRDRLQPLRGGGPTDPGRRQSLAGCRHRRHEHAGLPPGSRCDGRAGSRPI